MKRIGILGGTFDPPHNGHLIIADEVRETLNLDEVWFIPSNEPPHKDKARANTIDRMNMVKNAIQHNEYFKLNTIEIDRLGKSFTIDTMKALKSEHNNCSFYFIIGADMVEYLPNWKNIDALIEIVTFVAVKRPRYTINTVYPIIEVDVPIFDMSSSEIRRRIRNSQTVTYLIPPSVNLYIRKRGLYAET